MVDYPCPYRNCQFIAGESAILGQIHMYCWLCPIYIYIYTRYVYIYIVCVYIFITCIYITYIHVYIPYICILYIYPFIIHPLIVGCNIICVFYAPRHHEVPSNTVRSLGLFQAFQLTPGKQLCFVTWKWKPKFNGHFRILKWRYLPYIRPIF